MAGPNVFGDGRFGAWIVNPANFANRAAGLRSLGVTDVFFPRTAAPADLERARVAGFVGAHVYEVNAKDVLPSEYADRTMADVLRLKAGAAELNIELSADAELAPYIRAVVSRIRQTMPSRRLRVNIAWRKGGALPVDLFQHDPNLYVCEQSFFDPSATMVPTSAADALENLTRAGVPEAKASVCYGGAGPSPKTTSPRVCTFPYGWTPSRGVVFQDDLLAEVGAI
jgi:hypothetical protein